MYDFKYIFERETPAVPPKGEAVWKKGEERERGIRINCRFLVRPCWPEKLCDHIFFNPLKGRSVNWLHFAIQVQPTFLISDIRALWRSPLSAKVPECQKLKM